MQYKTHYGLTLQFNVYFPVENNILLCNSFDIIEVNKHILPTPQKSTILVDPLDYGVTFGLDIAAGDNSQI